MDWSFLKSPIGEEPHRIEVDGLPFFVVEVTAGSGSLYYRCHRGSKPYLHRFIYEKVYGPIPEGCVVHHKDGNGLNNHPDNLALLTKKAHDKYHLAQGRYTRAKREPQCFECAVCGSEFTSIRADSKYCSQPCRTKGSRNARAGRPLAYSKPDGRQPTEKNCLLCGERFSTLKWKTQHFCSRSCARKHVWAEKRKSKPGKTAHKRECRHCQEPFETTDSRKVYCGPPCKIAFNNARR